MTVVRDGLCSAENEDQQLYAWLPSAATRYITERRTGGYIIWGVRRLNNCTTVVG
jgi:hypothetical protein